MTNDSVSGKFGGTTKISIPKRDFQRKELRSRRRRPHSRSGSLIVQTKDTEGFRDRSKKSGRRGQAENEADRDDLERVDDQ